MKKLLLFLAIVLSFAQLSAQKSGMWSRASVAQIPQSAKIRTTDYSEREQFYQLNVNQLRQALTNVNDRSSGLAGVEVLFPNIDGQMEQFMVWENSNFAPELQARFPQIRAYVGHSLADRSATINFSLSPLGVQTMVLRADNNSEFIESYTKDRSVYVLFDSKTRMANRLPFKCATVDQRLVQDITTNGDVLNRSNDQTYKTMRLALSVVGEYTQYFGGTVAGAMAGMNASMTRVNGVLEKDVALHLNMIPNNDLLVYTNPNTDPYSGAAAGSGGAWNAEVQSTITSVIGEANYDIGHLFGADGGGGNAGCIGCVCVSPTAQVPLGKGSAFTSPYDAIPAGDNYDIDYVVHEMGHQLGATHTFSNEVESAGSNVEPGSGSTIMGYAGIVAPANLNVQAHSDAYYVYKSIQQIQTNLAAKTCPVSVTVNNTPPTVSAGADFTIPKGTAFILKGVVSDAQGDALTYCWEQNNNAPGSQSGANSICYATKTTGPNFRSFSPTTTPDRYMPAFSKVLAGTLTTTWESVNTTARTSRYTLTVRDNNVTGQQTNTDEVLVTTSGTVGPFAFTSQNTTSAWNLGENQTITWDVNNTNTLPGSANVNIKLSTDGGLTFPYILAADTPNDGSEVIAVPDVSPSLTCRLLIEPTGNVYYAVNSANFYIGYTIVTSCNTYTFNTPFAIPNGSNSYTVKSINVPAGGIISDVNITVNATHPNLQNLTIAVIRPNGGTLQPLFAQQCAGNADMNVTFDQQGGTFTCASPTAGTYAPPTVTNMNTAFNGFNPVGNWQFGFKDTVAGADAGTVNSIALEVCSQTTILSTQDFGFEGFALYPNPSNGTFKVQFNSTASGKVNVAVHDMSGRRIFDRSYANSGLFAEDIQLGNAQAGVYLVSVTDGAKKIVKRIVIQ
jgi:subtilisin-like proprotein convertase family protein